MKNFTFFGLVLLLFFGLSSANTNTYSPEYKAPTLKTALNFSAKYEDAMIKTSRASIDTITSNPMKRYKVIKSKTNNSPIYPEDWYIMAISDKSYTFFTETNPELGTWYYRVCAIMEDMNRYCSNVVEIHITNTTTPTKIVDTTVTTKAKKTIATSLTTNMKTTIDKLIVAFMDKLNTKYPNSTSSKITFLDVLIKKLSTLTTGKNTALYSYLKEKLEAQNDLLRLQHLLDI